MITNSITSAYNFYRSSTPVTKALRPRVKVSESPSSGHGGEKFDDDEDTMDEGPLVEKRKNSEAGSVRLFTI